MRLEMIGTGIVFCTAFFAVILGNFSFMGGGHALSAGLAGFAISSALNLSGLMAWMVRTSGPGAAWARVGSFGDAFKAKLDSLCRLKTMCIARGWGRAPPSLYCFGWSAV